MTETAIVKLTSLRRFWPKWFPRQSARYWATSLVILVVATWTKPFIEQSLRLDGPKNWLFMHLSQSVTNPSRPRDFRLVMIGDDDYWDGPLHHRVPTDRSYLGRLIRAADVADASQIAVDFDFRLPDPKPSLAPGDYRSVDTVEAYRAETDDFVRAVDDVAARRPIVLSKRMTGPDNGPFSLEADAFQAYGICTALKGDGVWANPGTPEFPLSPEAQANISCGYIALMNDKREVPPAVHVAGSPWRLDSFPIAMVRARDPGVLDGPDLGSSYASYIPSKVAKTSNVIVSAHDLLSDPKKGRQLAGRPVIIGAAWSQRAKGSGGLIDLHDTPIGPISGALVHENMAEAVLSHRFYRAIPDPVLVWLEILLGAIAAVWFAAMTSWPRRSLAIAAAMIVLLALQWLTLQLFGVFLDAFVPIVGLALHALLDRAFGVHGHHQHAGTGDKTSDDHTAKA